jgi:hypothetical protein
MDKPFYYENDDVIVRQGKDFERLTIIDKRTGLLITCKEILSLNIRSINELLNKETSTNG